MTDHPITPPPELVRQWLGDYFGCVVNGELSGSEKYLATQAARWGADQELEACCEHLKRSMSPRATIDYLRAARRPEPPSLKEQALLKTTAILDDPSRALLDEVREALELNRRALEQFND